MIKNKEYWDYKNIQKLMNLYDLEIILNANGTLSVRGANDCYYDTYNNKEEYDNFRDLVDDLDVLHFDLLVDDLLWTYDLCYDDFEYWVDIWEWLSYHYLETAYNCEVPYDDIDLLGLVCNGK